MALPPPHECCTILTSYSFGNVEETLEGRFEIMAESFDAHQKLVLTAEIIAVLDEIDLPFAGLEYTARIADPEICDLPHDRLGDLRLTAEIHQRGLETAEPRDIVEDRSQTPPKIE